eukprot:1601880-Pleurochrysis_carterae.AAC.1
MPIWIDSCSHGSLVLRHKDRELPPEVGTRAKSSFSRADRDCTAKMGADRDYNADMDRWLSGTRIGSLPQEIGRMSLSTTIEAVMIVGAAGREGPEQKWKESGHTSEAPSNTKRASDDFLVGQDGTYCVRKLAHQQQEVYLQWRRQRGSCGSGIGAKAPLCKELQGGSAAMRNRHSTAGSAEAPHRRDGGFAG